MVLLWGPSYDSLTNHTSQWVMELAQLVKLDAAGPVIRKVDITVALDKARSGSSLAIFCGHGTPDALLGPPIEDPQGAELISNGVGKHSPIYDRGMTVIGPSSLFAFCCKAGRELGRTFATISSRAFMGYEDDLPLDLMNVECIHAWKKIVHAICTDLVRDGGIRPEHETALRGYYESALRYFRDEEGRTNPERIEMQMYILRHLKLLCLYSRG